MMDIGISWDGVACVGDWATEAQDMAFAGSDPIVDSDLVAAVLVSLFTDRRASDDFVLTDGTENRRGWWADVYADEPIGSRLWQLERAKRTQQTLQRARDYCTEALAWLRRDGLAQDVAVLTFWAGRVAMGIRITILLAAGPSLTVNTALPFGG